VTVNQLGIVVGIATFGSLYLNLAGKLPAVGGVRQLNAFTLSSAHAYLTVSAALAALAVAGAALALAHVRAVATLCSEVRELSPGDAGRRQSARQSHGARA